jgi:hypothetical protein
MLARRGLFAGLLPDPTLHATNIFRTHPDYASAFSAMSRMRSGLGMGVAAVPSLPLDRTYELYELWCYVGLLASIAERFPASRPKVAEILRGCHAPSGLGIALLSGKAHEIPLSPHLRIGYQRRFGPLPSVDGARTLLLEVVPDITVAYFRDNGLCQGLVVFDPKYRANQSLLDGLRDMHVYRDAIVGSDGGRLIRAAAALAPRPTGLPTVSASFPSIGPECLPCVPATSRYSFSICSIYRLRH